MHVFKTLAAAAALAVTAGATQAATYNAISYSDVVEGTCSLAGSARCTADNRKTLGNLVDDNKNTFYSLGLGGLPRCAAAGRPDRGGTGQSNCKGPPVRGGPSAACPGLRQGKNMTNLSAWTT